MVDPVLPGDLFFTPSANLWPRDGFLTSLTAAQSTVSKKKSSSPTVDGRNPAPVDMYNIPLFIGFHTSQVVQDFSHQPYCSPF